MKSPRGATLENKCRSAGQGDESLLKHRQHLPAPSMATPGRKWLQSDRLLLLLLPLLLLLLAMPAPSNQVHLIQQQQQQQQLRPSANNQRLQVRPSAPLSANQHPDAPRLIPLSALDRYQEGAELKLFCAASAPTTAGRLQFEWRKNQLELLDKDKAQVHIGPMDESSSLLRIGRLEADDSGNYTCLVRNQLGQDSSSVRVQVNVRLKWIKEPPGELQVRAGKSLQLECDASGQPAPLISWTSVRDQQTINSKSLRFERLAANDSGLYECRATTSDGSGSASGGEQLRKLVRLTVNGKLQR